MIVDVAAEMIVDVRKVETARLSLVPVVAQDAEPLFPIFSDPRGWWYEPERRH